MNNPAKVLILLIAALSLILVGKGITGFVVSEPCSLDSPCEASQNFLTLYAGILVFLISLSSYAFLQRTSKV